MAGGGVYLETHHVVPLSEKGVDHERNVVALCPNDHREAHHGERRDAIRTRLLAMLAEVYGR
jgi:5-methylcytosine-specific restriction protein A